MKGGKASSSASVRRLSRPLRASEGVLRVQVQEEGPEPGESVLAPVPFVCVRRSAERTVLGGRFSLNREDVLDGGWRYPYNFSRLTRVSESQTVIIGGGSLCENFGL
jgi:hypothetical protein